MNIQSLKFLYRYFEFNKTWLLKSIDSKEGSSKEGSCLPAAVVSIQQYLSWGEKALTVLFVDGFNLDYYWVAVKVRSMYKAQRLQRSAHP